MRGVGREELLGELLGGAAGRVGQLVRDLVEPVAHQPLDLAVGEGGRAQRLGEQAERLGQPGDRDLQGDPDAGVVGVRVEGGAAALQLGGELLGGVLVGALRQGARHDRGDAVEALGLGVQRGVEGDLDGDDLLAGAVAAQHGQPVVQGAALGGGEGPGPGGAGRAAAGGTPWSSDAAASLTGPPPRSRRVVGRVGPVRRRVRRDGLVDQHRPVVRAQPRPWRPPAPPRR